ncbi:MAG: hypothetical protein WBF09_11045, partial [Candidatus Acidiferrum sp.]
GRIAYRGGMGPFHYDPTEVRAWLAARYGAVTHPTAPAAPATSASPQSSPQPTSPASKPS